MLGIEYWQFGVFPSRQRETDMSRVVVLNGQYRAGPEGGAAAACTAAACTLPSREAAWMRIQQHLNRDNSSASKHRVHVTAGRFGKQPSSSSGFGHLNSREGFKVLLESTAGALLPPRLARLTEVMVVFVGGDKRPRVH